MNLRSDESTLAQADGRNASAGSAFSSALSNLSRHSYTLVSVTGG
jgi:hypothetical protein